MLLGMCHVTGWPFVVLCRGSSNQHFRSRSKRSDAMQILDRTMSIHTILVILIPIIFLAVLFVVIIIILLHLIVVHLIKYIEL